MIDMDAEERKETEELGEDRGRSRKIKLEQTNFYHHHAWTYTSNPDRIHTGSGIEKTEHFIVSMTYIVFATGKNKRS